MIGNEMRFQPFELLTLATLIILLAAPAVLVKNSLRYRSFRPKTRSAIRQFYIATCIGIGMVWIYSTDVGNHWVDNYILRAAPLHYFFQTSSYFTSIPPHDYLIVFQHIPRTAGDSARTHLFNACDWDFTPLWRHEPDAPPVPIEWNETFVMNAKLIKGYFSLNDLDRLEQIRKIKVFTILRHPLERVISFYDYLGFSDVSSYFNISSEAYKDIPYAKAIHTASYTYNGLTYQLGDQMHFLSRNSTPEQALARAKANLERMEFVGFYENLAHDFWKLKTSVFKDVSVPFVFPWAYWLGTVVGYPRMRVLKYQHQMDSQMLKQLDNITNLDMEIYNWARKRFHQDYNLYPTFTDFLKDHILPICIILIISIFLMSVMIWLAVRGVHNYKSRRRAQTKTT